MLLLHIVETTLLHQLEVPLFTPSYALFRLIERVWDASFVSTLLNWFLLTYIFFTQFSFNCLLRGPVTSLTLLVELCTGFVDLWFEIETPI
jgi:hypothetical protein